MDNIYFEILEDAYRSEFQIKKTTQYRIALKFLNLYNSIRKGFFWEYLKHEYRNRCLSKYSKKVPKSDYRYGQYPDDDIKILVYTCVTNGYDMPLSPLFKPKNVDYVFFTDNINHTVDGWQIREIPTGILQLGSGTIVNRYFKMHPAEFGKGYDYAIYVDGNVQVISNIRNIVNAISPISGLAIHRHPSRICIYDEFEACKIYKKGNLSKMEDQIKRYKKDNFPSNFGLLECTIIVSDIHNTKGIEILDKWWHEFIHSESLRDQLSLPYVIYKNGYSIDDIGNLGFDLKLNPKFRWIVHSNHNVKYII